MSLKDTMLSSRAAQSARDFSHGRNPSTLGEVPGFARDDALGVRWLGRVNFADALKLQEKIVAQKRSDPNVADTVLLLEHDPVYTIGRTPDQSSLRGGSHLPHPFFQINRGGQATYHGPGQLMGYPMIDLRHCGQDLHKYLRWIESLLIEFLSGFGIEAQRREGLTGVWVQQRKIASIGVGVRHWITMHGFALNVCDDLSPFDQIKPCGISNVMMTSIEKETATSMSVPWAAVAMEKVIRQIWQDSSVTTKS
jgi:lipoyl(octanoyl) transferase